MAVVIKTVENKKELLTFAKFGNRFYKGHKCYVPSMPSDDMVTFDRTKNAAFEFCEAEYFLAYKNGEVVGRVAAIVNHKANKAWNVEQVRFGWFDFIDDLEVSKALLDAVIAFGKSKGMNQIAQEGAIQIFFEPNSGLERVIVGVVGVLQFEVLEYRLKSEYGCDLRRTNMGYSQIRWIENEDINVKALNLTSDTRRIQDLKGRKLLLFTNPWNITWATDHNKELILSEFGKNEA